MLNTLFSEETEALGHSKVHLMTKAGAMFLCSVSVQLEHSISEEVPTAATNGKWIKYNPKFFAECSKEQRVGLIAHEVWHVALLHMFRGEGKDPYLWNMAGDYVINGMLLAANFKLPEGGLHDPKFDGWSTDQVYDYLVQENIEPPPDFECDLLPPDQITPELEQAVTNSVIKAACRVQMEGGDVPEEILRAIETLINPKLSWKEILYRFVDEKVKDDFSWARPNKKYMPDWYLPSRFSETLNTLTSAIDTSGSITKELLQEILSEIEYINQTIKPDNLTVLDCDSRIHNIYHVTPNDSILDFKFTGGGGTSGLPVLNYVIEHGSNLTIYFTDGEMSLNLPDPGHPFLWVIFGGREFTAPFGEVAYVND